MASVNLLILVVVCSVQVGKSAGGQFMLKCSPAVGVIGHTTHIPCRTEPNMVNILTAVLQRAGQRDKTLTFVPDEDKTIGDTRYKVQSDGSLVLHDTTITDEGEYWYLIRTSLGKDEVKFSINVTAPYRDPIITTNPEKLRDNAPGSLSCKANGGYPAGTIHWFDQINTNWTESSTLDIRQEPNGLFTLSSTLSLKTIDSLRATFRCVVLNRKYEEEGQFIYNEKIIGNPVSTVISPTSTVKNVIAPVVVIGSLIVGLLVVLLFKRRRARPSFPTEPIYTEEQEVLNQIHEKPPDMEKTFEV